MITLPVVSTPSTDIQPYIDWYQRCGILGVVTEDDAQRRWEGWLRRCHRFGRRTPTADLHRHFPDQHLIKQVDIPDDHARSSDICHQHLRHRDRCLLRYCDPIMISEHAVRRYWEHTGHRPDILDWFNSFPQDPQWDQEYLLCQQGLLAGSFFRSPNGLEIWDIDQHCFAREQTVGFRVRTIIPIDLLNERQTVIWYKLKQEQQK